MCPIPLWRVPRINFRDMKFLSSASCSGWKFVVTTERLTNYPDVTNLVITILHHFVLFVCLLLLHDIYFVDKNHFTGLFQKLKLFT